VTVDDPVPLPRRLRPGILKVLDDVCVSCPVIVPPLRLPVNAVSKLVWTDPPLTGMLCEFVWLKRKLLAVPVTGPVNGIEPFSLPSGSTLIGNGTVHCPDDSRNDIVPLPVPVTLPFDCVVSAMLIVPETA
jgi:hypothetical protein